MQSIDILILSNGTGEVTTWVRPFVRACRQDLGDDRSLVRISVMLSPCPHASGEEEKIVLSYPEVDRVQGPKHFFRFLLWGRTAQNWGWRDRGVVLFLGGDQFFAVAIGKRLGYRTIIYAEWEARWYRWIDRFGVMKPEIVTHIPARYANKFIVVGDLMLEASGGGEWRKSGASAVGGFPDLGSHCFAGVPPVVASGVRLAWPPLGIMRQGGVEEGENDEPSKIELIGLLPGSKPSKLAQGVPLVLAIAEHIQAVRPQTRFVIPVAPTLDLATLARFADLKQNPVIQLVGGKAAKLLIPKPPELPFLQTDAGLRVELWTRSPAYDLLTQCCLCFTTVGANTAELGALAVPMIVLIPTQQLDAMRTWGGLPGILARMPGLGTFIAKLINQLYLQRIGLLAWPNIWAQAEVVPELVGKLQSQDVAALALDFLNHPAKLQQMSDRLRSIRGQPGAAQKLAKLVRETINDSYRRN